MSRTNKSDILRSFGMSGYLVSEELKAVEKLHDLELGHLPKVTETAEKTYFPQFEESVREEASTMAVHYEAFYCLEQSIRKLIIESLAEAEPGDWWRSGRIPPDIVTAAEGLIRKEVDNGMTRRSDKPIDYTTFGQLAVIINSNWDVFGAIFTSRRAVEKVMASLNMLRGPIAHCSPMTEDEVDRLALTVKDWFRIMA
jgi:hypothetical protein